jgi:hypothetical protein
MLPSLVGVTDIKNDELPAEPLDDDLDVPQGDQSWTPFWLKSAQHPYNSKFLRHAQAAIIANELATVKHENEVSVTL